MSANISQIWRQRQEGKWRELNFHRNNVSFKSLVKTDFVSKIHWFGTKWLFARRRRRRKPFFIVLLINDSSLPRRHCSAVSGCWAILHIYIRTWRLWRKAFNQRNAIHDHVHLEALSKPLEHFQKASESTPAHLLSKSLPPRGMNSLNFDFTNCCLTRRSSLGKDRHVILNFFGKLEV